MLIDWFTVIAQAVNFLVLVWLMKRYLYQPILKALAAREQRIAADLADAKAKMAEAAREREEFARKYAEFDRQRAALMYKVQDEAGTERNRLFEAARKDADEFGGKLQGKLDGEYSNLRDSIRHRTRDGVFEIARKTLSDLAGVTLEERMVEVFMVRLQGLGSEEKARLAALLKSPDMPVVVRSAFELASAQHAAIEAAIRTALAGKAPIRFEIVPGLVSGIELVMQGQKVAWCIDDYIASLENGVDELIKERDKARGAQAQAKKSSVLTQQIGKRAYELYAEHGSKTGHAAEDWKQAEHEIRKEKLKPIKTEPKPEAKPDAEAKSETKNP
jgi:F-type H+-transporting ATPase subunit b